MKELKPEDRKVQICIMLEPEVLRKLDAGRKKEMKAVQKKRISRSSWINANLNKAFNMELKKARPAT